MHEISLKTQGDTFGLQLDSWVIQIDESGNSFAVQQEHFDNAYELKKKNIGDQIELDACCFAQYGVRVNV